MTKSELNKAISNQKTTSSELLQYLRAIYNNFNISLKSIKGNLYEIIIDGKTQEDFAVLKTGKIENGKSTIKFYVLKLTN